MDALTKDVREAAGLTQVAAAVLAGVSPPTWRIFELAGPDALRQASKRKACEAALEKMVQMAELKKAG